MHIHVFFKVEYTMKTMKTIGGVILGLPNSVAVFLKAPQKEMTNNEHEKLEVSGSFQHQ